MSQSQESLLLVELELELDELLELPRTSEPLWRLGSTASSPEAKLDIEAFARFFFAVCNFFFPEGFAALVFAAFAFAFGFALAEGLSSTAN